MQKKGIKKMNTLDKTIVNAKIRMDLAKDAVCNKFFAKKNGDSDIISKVIFMVVIVALVMIVKWAVTWILTGKTQVTNGTTDYTNTSIMGELSSKMKSIFDSNN